MVAEPVHDVCFAPNLGRSYHLLAIASKDLSIISLKPLRFVCLVVVVVGGCVCTLVIHKQIYCYKCIKLTMMNLVNLVINGQCPIESNTLNEETVFATANVVLKWHSVLLMWCGTKVLPKIKHTWNSLTSYLNTQVPQALTRSVVYCRYFLSSVCWQSVGLGSFAGSGLLA